MDATAVIDLRRARRRRRLQKTDVSEALYRGYLTLLGVAVAVYALSNLPADHRLTAAQISSVAHQGTALIGLALAVVVGLTLRSGARGGPLVLEAPDIQHVLLSPCSRGRALRAPALQKIRTTIIGWSGAGAVAGLLASKRFPGSVAAWLASCGGGGDDRRVHRGGPDCSPRGDVCASGGPSSSPSR